MELELKHIAPYLPYKLDVQENKSGLIGEMLSLTNDRLQIMVIDPNWGWRSFLQIKPILRPLRDLTIEIEHNGEKFIPIDWFKPDDSEMSCNFLQERDKELIEAILHISMYDISVYEGNIDINLLPYFVMEKLFEWHFDILGLIIEGLATDINTLKITEKA